MANDLTLLLERLDALLDRAERLVPAAPQQPAGVDLFDTYIAFRWERQGEGGALHPIQQPHLVELDDLVGIDFAKNEVLRNTAQFLAGLPANNVLLWGERGTGKSACVKGVLTRFSAQRLRMVEVQRWDLLSLPAIVRQLRNLPYRFILFCDDLAFSDGEPEYRGLKTLLEGGLEARPDNILIYATSNRRHLLPESMADNVGGAEIHPEEAAGEKLALSDRFGLTIGFYSFNQETFLNIVDAWLERSGLDLDRASVHQEALRWAFYGGRRSGRAARQFVDDLVGRTTLSQG